MQEQAIGLGLVMVGVVLMGAGPAVAQPEHPEPPLGKGAAMVVASEWIWVEAGSRLLREPDPGSSHLAWVEARAELEVLEVLEVLERGESWFRVRHGALTGWISIDGESGGRPPPRGLTETGRQVARARDIFKLEAGLEPFGEFAFYTDIKDKRWLSILEKTSRHLPEAYESRYGLLAKASIPETILLFASEADYRAFVGESFGESARHRPDLRGHSAPGIAVLYAGDHSPEEVAAVLVHELTHLLNRRVFTVPIPPWLEEGLANDLGFCRIDARGRLRLTTLGGHGVVVEQPEYEDGGFLRLDRRVNLTGPMASLRTVQERWRESEASSTRLMQLDWDEFIEPENRRLHYAASAFLVRYLLDSGEGARDDRLAGGFRSFLRAVASGAPAGPEALAGHVSRGGTGALDDGFARWIQTR